MTPTNNMDEARRDPPLAMRVCPECKGTGNWQTFVGLEDCMTCGGKGEIPVTPPASTESKSLGDIAKEAWVREGHPQAHCHTPNWRQQAWQNIGEAVEAIVSLRYKGEIERLKEMLQQKVWPHETEVPMREEISRLTTLWKEAEKQVTSLIHYREIHERQEDADEIQHLKAENARKDAVIEDMRDALKTLHSYNDDIERGRINYRPLDHVEVIAKALARLAQKGKP